MSKKIGDKVLYRADSGNTYIIKILTISNKSSIVKGECLFKEITKPYLDMTDEFGFCTPDKGIIEKCPTIRNEKFCKILYF
jgi:hypothetical protein